MADWYQYFHAPLSSFVWSGDRDPNPQVRFVGIGDGVDPAKLHDIFPQAICVAVRGCHVEALSRSSSVANLKYLWINCPGECDPRDLARFSNISALRVNDASDTAFLRRFARLTHLAIQHFPKVQALDDFATLKNLKSLSLRTDPSWDSRKHHIVESFGPLSELSHLEELDTIGVVPEHHGLSPLYDLPSLRSVELGPSDFSLEEFAGLVKRQPKATGSCTKSHFPCRFGGQSFHCNRCGTEEVVLVGPRPRARKTLCPKCNHRRLTKHVEYWQALLKQS